MSSHSMQHLDVTTNSVWSAKISPFTVLFEENSSSIELALPENNNNWIVKGKFDSLIVS